MQVQLTDEAVKQYQKLPVVMRARVEDVFDRLRNWPEVSGVKKLKGNWKHHSRIRSGDYRIIFQVVNEHKIKIVRIAHRRDIYEG